MKKTNGTAHRKFTWSKKKTAVTAASLVLALTMVVGLIPAISLRAHADPLGTISSISGEKSIPDVYQAVNVPAGTPIIKADGTKTTSTDGIEAFDFHIFANEFASKAHTCGNVAVNDFGGTVLSESGAPEIGSREAHDTASAKMSYVNHPIDWMMAHYENLVFGYGNDLSGKGQVTLTNKDGKKFLFGNANPGFYDNIYIDDATPMVNIQEGLEEAEGYQRYLVDMMDKVNESGDPQTKRVGVGMFAYDVSTGKTMDITEGTGDDAVTHSVRVLHNDELFNGGPVFGPGGAGMGFGPGGKVIDLKQYPEDTIIIDFNEGTMYSWFNTTNYNEAINFLSGSVELKGTVGKRVIINIDTTGYDQMKFMDTHMKADKLTNEEESVHHDNNILWNFYKRTASRGGASSNTAANIKSSDSTISVGGTWIGTILAPDASVMCRAGLNGSIIANKVATTAETHKSDYTGEKSLLPKKTSIKVTKIWNNDSADTRPEYITIKLLRDNKVIKTVQMTPKDNTEAQGDVWTYEFTDLDAHDATGKNFKYKIEEIVPAGYTGTVVNNTIINTAKGGAPTPNGQLTVIKTAADGTTKLAGAKLRLTPEGANVNLSGAQSSAAEFRAGDREITWTSSASGDTITNLPLGKYTITEVGAPNGYKLSTESVPVTVTAAGTTVTVKNYPLEVKFLKTGGLNKTPLTGGKFTLTANWGTDISNVKVNGQNLGSYFAATGNDITFTNLPAGSYTITETEAPEGYEIAAPITFIVEQDGKIRIDGQEKNKVEMNDDAEVIQEQPEYGAFTFSKIYSDGNDSAQATFTLRNVAGKDITGVKVDGTEVTPTGSKNDTITFTTTGAQDVVVSNLLVGNYVLTETSAPAGYKPVDPKSVSIAANQTAESNVVEAVNAPVTATISKKDMTNGEELPGAKLTLTLEKPANTGDKLTNVTSSITEVSGTRTDTSITWFSESEANTLSKLPAGYYSLTEVTWPDGYMQAETIYFKVEENGTIKSATKSGNTYTDGASLSDGTVTMFDAPSVVKIVKTGKNNAVLAGASLKLTANSNVSLANVTGTLALNHVDAKNITWESATTAQELRHLPDGSYTLRETAAPEGYGVAGDITFTVANGIISESDGGTLSNGTLTMADEKIRYYDIDFSKIKQAANGTIPDQNPVPGAVLGIFKADATSFTPSEAISIINTTTDPSTLRLPDGHYVLVEIQAPDGYLPTEQKIKFSLNQGIITIDGTTKQEIATASYGKPSDKGYALDEDCYYSLETTELFEAHDGYPNRVEFTLPAEYTCTSFKLYKDNGKSKVEDPSNPVNIVSGVSVTQPSQTSGEGGAQVKNYTIDFSASGQYDPNCIYYAVLDIVDSDNNPATDVGNVKLNFVYKVQGGIEAGMNTYSPIAIDTVSEMPSKVYIQLDPVDSSKPVYLTHLTVHLCHGDNAYNDYIVKWSSTNGNIDLTSTGYIAELVLNQAYKPTGYNNQTEPTFDYKGDTPFTAGQTLTGNNTITHLYAEVTANNASDTVRISFNEPPGTVDSVTELSETTLRDNLTQADDDNDIHAAIRLPNKEKTTAPSCKVDLTKVSSENSATTIENAKFVLLDNDGKLVKLYAPYHTEGEEAAAVNVITHGNYIASADVPAAAPASPDTGWIEVNTLAEPLVTGSNGKIHVDGLKTVTYVFSEIEPASGYEAPENQNTQFKLTNGNETTAKELTITNKPKKGEIEFIKYDENNNPMPRAVFDLWSIALDGNVNTLTKHATGLTTGEDGKVKIGGLPLKRLYFAIETQAAPGTEIPLRLEKEKNTTIRDALIAQGGYDATKVSKPLPRLSVSEDEQHNEQDDAFYNIPQSSGITYSTTEGQPTYATKAQGKAGLRFGIILADSDDKESGKYLFVLNTAKADDAEKGIHAASETYAFVHNDISVPTNTGTIAVFNDSTKTKVLKTDGVAPLAGAKFMLTPASAGPNAQLAGVSSTTANDLAHAHYAVLTYDDGSTLNTFPDYELTAEDTAAGTTISYVEYITWTSTATEDGDVLLGLLNDTDYNITEVEAPKGYEKAADTTVTGGGSVTVTDTVKTCEADINIAKILTGREMLDSDVFTVHITDGKSLNADAQVDITNGVAKFTISGFNAVNIPATASMPSDNATIDTNIHDDIVQYKDYVFTVTENKPDDAAERVPGVAYSKAEYEVTVRAYLRDDGSVDASVYSIVKTWDDEGKEIAEPETAADAAFTNAYEVDKNATANIEFSFNKKLTGRDSLENEKFYFKVTENGEQIGELIEVSELTKDTAKAITVPEITYRKGDIGTHTYTIYETDSDGNVLNKDSTDDKGVTYSDPITVTVEVYDKLDSTIGARVKEQDSALSTFINTYATAGSTEASVSGTKTFTNGTIGENEFTIGAYLEGQDTPVATSKVGTDGSYTLTVKGLTENQSYTIKEVPGNDNGVIYDDSEYNWVIVVEDNGRGGYGVKTNVVTQGSNKIDTDKVDFTNAARSARISKCETVDGNDTELAGATLMIEAVETVEKDANGRKLTLEGVTGKKVDGSDVEIIKTGVANKTNYTYVQWQSSSKDVVLSKLPAGVYKLTETIAPAGYTIASSVYFKVDEDGKVYSSAEQYTYDSESWTGKDKDKVKMIDEVTTAKISKAQIVNGQNEELPGATLMVEVVDTFRKDSENKNLTLQNVTAENATLTKTGITGKADNTYVQWTSGSQPVELSKLPAGVYSLTETIAPAGYAIATTKYFKVDENGNIYSSDTRKTYTANWGNAATGNKVDMIDSVNTAYISKQAVGGGPELPGAKLTLTAESSGVKLTNVTSAIDEVANSRTDTSITWISVENDANTLSKLPAGYYSLTEVTAPNGYDIAETIYFKVESDGKIKNATKKADGSFTDGSVVTDKTVVMYDSPVVPEATISKQAVGGGSELAGAELTVKLESPDHTGDTLASVTDSLGTARKSTDKLSITWTSGTTANKLSKLPAGYYSLTEITAPNGYEKAETIYFKVEEDGTVKTATKNANGTFTSGSAVTDKTITMFDAHSMEATISKRETGSGSELAGAELTVTLVKPDNTGDTLANVTDSLGTAKKADDNMSITWTSGSTENKLSKLPAGIYSLTEVTAPNGYEKAETIYFKVESDGTVKSVPAKDYKENGTTNWKPVDNNRVIMYDKPSSATYKFEFTKKDCFDRNLAGAKFQLKGTGYDVTATSDSTGKVVFNNIPAGNSYVLTETEAPQGFNRVTTSITVTVSENGDFSYKDSSQAALTHDKVEKAFINKVVVDRGPGSTDLKIGDSVNLKNELLKAHPDYSSYNITWRSSDGSVVSVDQNGNTRVLGNGEATITAYYGDTPLMTFVLGADDEPEQSVVIGDNTVPNTRDLIIKWIKIASITLVISTMIVLGCIYLFKRRKRAKAAQ